MFDRKKISIAIAIIFSLLLLLDFLYQTQIIRNPLITALIAVFILMPFVKESEFVKRIVLMISLIFIGWLLSEIGFALLPFALSFLIAYLFDPIVTFLSKKKFPRWLAALLIILIFVGAVSSVAVLVFPVLFSQLDVAIDKFSSLVNTVSDYLDSRKFYNLLGNLGLPEDKLREIIKREFIPKVEGIFTVILEALLSLVTSLSKVATQVLNAILIPILSFYFLKDFNRLKELIKSILQKKDKKLLNDLKRINHILRTYIGWQICAAAIIATVSSTAFSLFKLPFPVVLGVLCGLLNPIPYLGIFASMIIGAVTIVIVGAPNMLQQVIVLISVITALHFINTYFLEPNVTGKLIGVHPVLLLASLFVFGGLFGFVGLLIAVPTTAVIMMFFNDWRKKLAESEQNLFDEEIIVDE